MPRDTVFTEDEVGFLSGIARNWIAEQGSLYNDYDRIVDENKLRAKLGIPLAEILTDMETSDVSNFAVKDQPNELRTRMQVTDVVNRRKYPDIDDYIIAGLTTDKRWVKVWECQATSLAEAVELAVKEFGDLHSKYSATLKNGGTETCTCHPMPQSTNPDCRKHGLRHLSGNVDPMTFPR